MPPKIGGAITEGGKEQTLEEEPNEEDNNNRRMYFIGDYSDSAESNAAIHVFSLNFGLIIVFALSSKYCCILVHPVPILAKRHLAIGLKCLY